MKDHIKVLLALKLGLAIGLLLGILYAPHKGKTIRNMIRNRASESKDIGMERLEEMLYKRK